MKKIYYSIVIGLLCVFTYSVSIAEEIYLIPANEKYRNRFILVNFFDYKDSLISSVVAENERVTPPPRADYFNIEWMDFKPTRELRTQHRDITCILRKPDNKEQPPKVKCALE